MPSHYDTTYHWEYSKPNYDTLEDKKKAQTIREADYVLERRAPREPTREEELEYLNWLQDQFWHDPWFTPRFRKYMAAPKRWPWKNQREIKRQHQVTWVTNFGIGFLLTWPFAVFVGRWSKSYQGGVPVVPQQRYIHDFFNLDPSHLARKTFRFWFIGTCMVGGWIFAQYTTTDNQKRDAWYQRPDLKPFPAMVPKEELDITERTMLESHYQSFRNKENKNSRKRSAWYRLLFPNDADFSVKENPYALTHRFNVYNPGDNIYLNYDTGHFMDHVSE